MNPAVQTDRRSLAAGGVEGGAGQFRLQQAGGPLGGAVANLTPGLHLVVQPPGRLIRTPEDRGTLLLLDERFASPEVRALLPPWWGVG